jgi:hypothetical protein
LVKSAKGAKLGMSQFKLPSGLKAAVGLGGGESTATSIRASVQSYIPSDDGSSIASNPYGFGGLDASFNGSIMTGSVAGPGDSVHSSQAAKGKAADEQEWQFLAVDSTGKVVAHTVAKKAFMLVASKLIVLDPAKGAPKFFSLACRFRSPLHP